MRSLLIVVDMQNDFIDGALGSDEAKAVVDNVVKKIELWEGDVIATMDTHNQDYLETREGKYLPVEHCIKDTDGWHLHQKINEVVRNKGYRGEVMYKESFGSLQLAKKCEPYDYVEIIGVCTDICVISNALIIKNMYPELDIAVCASCCAGTTPESHKAALLVMKNNQIIIW